MARDMSLPPQKPCTFFGSSSVAVGAVAVRGSDLREDGPGVSPQVAYCPQLISRCGTLHTAVNLTCCQHYPHLAGRERRERRLRRCGSRKIHHYHARTGNERQERGRINRVREAARRPRQQGAASQPHDARSVGSAASGASGPKLSRRKRRGGGDPRRVDPRPTDTARTPAHDQARPQHERREGFADALSFYCP